MFDRLTLEQKLLGINILLFLFVGATAFVLMTQERVIPEVPEFDIPRPDPSRLEARDARDYSAFGSRDVLGTLIMRPTPTQPPPPTPTPTPELAQAIRYWKPQGILPGFAFMIDQRTKEEWQMEKGKESETKIVNFQNADIPVKLADTDSVYMKAKFSYTNDKGTQEVWVSMFDEAP